MRDLLLGLRLAVTGGRGPQLRALLTAVGIAFGVFVLLVGASVPHVISVHDRREAARDLVTDESARDDFLRVAHTDTVFAGRKVAGLTVRPKGAAPVPPGLPRVPADGEAYVSPGLRKLIDGPGGELMRRRLGARIVGTIGDSGLTAPNDAGYVRGSASLPASQGIRVVRFGSEVQTEPLAPELRLLVILMIAALLFPVVVFVATSVRFGGEDRDRRLAALRLVGADRAMTARIAAGETLLGALAGLLAGAVVFLAGRPLLEHVSVDGLAVFAQDVQPDPFIALAGSAGLLAGSVLATLATLRGVAIEPLGVTRSARPRRRRLWWRFLPTLLGLALLRPFVGDVDALDDSAGQYQAIAGVLLVLAGLTTLLPWLVELVVRRSPSGPLPWQLAIRRLQVDGGTTGRVVAGIGVAVAGAIALQTVFSAAGREATVDTGVDTAQVSMTVDAQGGVGTATRLTGALARTPGVQRVVAYNQVDAFSGGRAVTTAVVTDCAGLRAIARIADCRDGASYVTTRGRRIGSRLRIGRDGPPVTIAGRAQLRGGILGPAPGRVLVTRGALHGAPLDGAAATAGFLLAPTPDDADDRARTAIAEVAPLAFVNDLRDTTIEAPELTSLRRVLFAGAALVLAVIGASLLVAAVEQLRERRRVLAVLSAFGTRRQTLAWSVLCQTAIPVVLGLVLAVATGLLLGLVLLLIADQPIVFDWSATAALTGAGGLVIAAVTAMTMPLLWRLMGPDALRVE